MRSYELIYLEQGERVARAFMITETIRFLILKLRETDK